MGKIKNSRISHILKEFGAHNEQHNTEVNRLRVPELKYIQKPEMWKSTF